jgi:hypothetical protein
VFSSFGVNHQRVSRRANGECDVAVFRISPKRDVGQFAASLSKNLECSFRPVAFCHLNKIGFQLTLFHMYVLHIISPKVQLLTRKSASKRKTMTVVQFEIFQIVLVFTFKQFFFFYNFPNQLHTIRPNLNC